MQKTAAVMCATLLIGVGVFFMNSIDTLQDELRQETQLRQTTQRLFDEVVEKEAQRKVAADTVREDPRDLVQIVGEGNSSCGSWLEARKTSPEGVRQQRFEAWASGYLTAYNVIKIESDGEILKTDASGEIAFFDRYCEQHPTKTFVSAVNMFISDQGGVP